MEKKFDNDVDPVVAQLERSNNKCYASTFKYIYIYIYIANSYLAALQGPSGPQVCAKEDNVGKHIRLY